MKSVEEEGLESSTLGLSFEVTDFHFVATVHPDKKELWVRCEATMPPIEGMTYPFTREVFLGTYARSFDHYHASSKSRTNSETCKTPSDRCKRTKVSSTDCSRGMADSTLASFVGGRVLIPTLDKMQKQPTY